MPPEATAAARGWPTGGGERWITHPQQLAHTMANFYEGIMAGGVADADAQERYLNVILRKETRRRAEDWTMEECACWAH